MSNLEHKKFPIGQFQQSDNICDIKLEEYIRVIKDFPVRLKKLIENFTDDQLDTQ